MKRIALACLLAAVSSHGLAQSVDRTATGIIVRPAQGSEGAVQLQVYDDGIIRATEMPKGSDGHLSPSLMVRAKPVTGGFTVTQGAGIVTLSTGKAFADVYLSSGRISFRDAAGDTVLAEAGPPTFTPASAEGVPSMAISQQFNRGTDEGFYGLGQHQNGQMNYNGEDVLLSQHNMDVAIPFVVSTRNYGLLWDNNSVTRFGDPEPYTYAGSPGDGLDVNAGTGWTATYSIKGKTVAQQQEIMIQLQYLDDVDHWPAGTRTPDNRQTVPGLHVTWKGR